MNRAGHISARAGRGCFNTKWSIEKPCGAGASASPSRYKRQDAGLAIKRHQITLDGCDVEEPCGDRREARPKPDHEAQGCRTRRPINAPNPSRIRVQKKDESGPVNGIQSFRARKRAPVTVKSFVVARESGEQQWTQNQKSRADAHDVPRRRVRRKEEGVDLDEHDMTRASQSLFHTRTPRSRCGRVSSGVCHGVYQR